MNKRIALIIALVLLMAFSLAACSTDYSRKGLKGTQDTSYAVLSNGGSVVQYGNYVYFINGYRGYNDELGTANLWGKVEKGGLYRAELRGSAEITEYDFYYSDSKVPLKTFKSQVDLTNSANKDLTVGLDFKYTPNTEVFEGYEMNDGEYLRDANGDKIAIRGSEDLIDVSLVVPKTIGTLGYSDGGIYIYDGFIYYASPNNSKNRAGTVQELKTDFYRTTLDGSKTWKIYTTKNDTSGSPYTFYKQGSSVYLVVKDGANVVSVKMSASKGKKMDKPVTIAENVTSVYLPKKDIYYNYEYENTRYKSFENGPEDFVYCIRAAKESEDIVGNVIELMRPNGKERKIIYNSQSSVSILSVDNGLLFYETPDLSGRTVAYTNLHNVLMQSSASYKKDPVASALIETYGEINLGSAPFTTLRGIFPNPQNRAADKLPSVQDAYVLGFGDDISIASPATGVRTLHTGNGTFVKVIEGMLYFISENNLMRVSLFDESPVAQTVVDGATNQHVYKFDFVGDYVMFYDDLDELATNYAKIKPLYDIYSESKFIGYRLESETLSEDED